MLSEVRSGRLFKAPRSGKGQQIRLTHRATETLRAHRKVQLEEHRKLAGFWQDQGLAFPSQVGTLLSARNLQRHFKSILERAGLSKGFRFPGLVSN